MKINKKTLFYFSPCGGSRKILEQMGWVQGAESPSVSYFFCDEFTDLTEDVLAQGSQEVDKNTLLFIGFPVYAGRVPLPFLKKLEGMRGVNTPTVLLATYGGRDYEDALVEMQDFVEQRGCRVIAAAAVVGEHAVVREVAHDRPDEEDRSLFRTFSNELKKKLEAIEEGSAFVRLKLPGNCPYVPYKPLPFRPIGTRKCVRCGQCVAHCPVQAIEEMDPRKTRAELCISCMRCVRICPFGARKYKFWQLWIARMYLKKKCIARAQTEIFISQ